MEQISVIILSRMDILRCWVEESLPAPVYSSTVTGMWEIHWTNANKRAGINSELITRPRFHSNRVRHDVWRRANERQALLLIHTGPRPRWHPPCQSWPFWCHVPFVISSSAILPRKKRRGRKKRKLIEPTSSRVWPSFSATSVKKDDFVTMKERTTHCSVVRSEHSRERRGMAAVRRVAANWIESSCLKNERSRLSVATSATTMMSTKCSRTAPGPAEAPHGACPACRTMRTRCARGEWGPE